MLFGRKKTETASIDPSTQKPVLRKSICTGEMTAGFRDLSGGAFHDVMLIRGEDDLREFMATYGITERPETEY